MIDAFSSFFARIGLTGKRFVIGVPMIWLLLFFVLPFLIVLKISLATEATAIPPYTPLFDWSGGWPPALQIDTDNYASLVGDDLYIVAYLSSIKFAFISTILCLLVAYPIAYGVTRSPKSWRNMLLMLIVLPFWTSLLLRVYSWIAILKNEGLLNNLLEWLGIINTPIPMMNTPFAVYVGIVYSYLPFMLLPLYATLERLDHAYLEAAADLGASRTRAFFTITLPLSIPGMVAGSMLVFIPAIGEFVIPSLLGGPSTLMIGRVLWDEFFLNQDWPTASAVAMAILFFLIAPIMIFQHYQMKDLEEL